MYTLGISCYFHDSAACLLKGDKIVAAAQEERFSRIKNDSSFPASAIQFCINFAKIDLKDLEAIVFYEKPILKFDRIVETHLRFAPLSFTSFLKSGSVWIKKKLFIKKQLKKSLKLIDESLDFTKVNLLFSTHHGSHSASAYYPSPFNEAVIITADSVGEWTSTSVSLGEDESIRLVKELYFPNSLGLLYSAFTYYLGFRVNFDESKVMGLAAYGDPIYKKLIQQQLILANSDSSFSINLKYFNYHKGTTMVGKSFELLFGRSKRKPSDPITKFHADIASSIQAVTEDTMLSIARNAYEEFKIPNLCLAGGIALNCVSNGKILKESGFKNIWIQPASGDAGCSIGAAYLGYYFNHPESVKKKEDGMQNCLLGPEYSDEEIIKDLQKFGCPINRIRSDMYYDVIAKLLADGNIIGYFKGRSEFGPRALGNRSILADPRRFEMRARINKKIKFRETFRPFAPAILEEFTQEWFELSACSPYMLLVANVSEKHRVEEDQKKESKNIFAYPRLTDIPAVTHKDFSARIQTVSKKLHPNFYRVINGFYKITGIPVLVNTSFNQRDEPIVNSPGEAINCFLNTDLDILIMEDFILKKDQCYEDIISQ